MSCFIVIHREYKIPEGLEESLKRKYENFETKNGTWNDIEYKIWKWKENDENKVYVWISRRFEDNSKIEKFLRHITKDLKCDYNQSLIIGHHSVYGKYILKKREEQEVNLKTSEEMRNTHKDEHEEFDKFLKENLIPAYRKKLSDLSSLKLVFIVISYYFGGQGTPWKEKSQGEFGIEAYTEHENMLKEAENSINQIIKAQKIPILLIHEVPSLRNWVNKASINVMWISFHHEDSDPVYIAIKEYDFKSLYKFVINKYLTLLIHRIAYLFLPLDIDLIGILEVLREDRVHDAESYFKEAFTVKENDQKKLKSPAEIIDKKLQKIKNGQIFKDLNLDDEIKKEIIDCIEKPENNLKIENVKEQLNENNFEKFKKKFGEYAENPEQNPFHKWFCKMIKGLENIKEKLNM